MPYTKQTWHNEPLTDTPLDADRMTHLEGQYDAVMADIPASFGVAKNLAVSVSSDMSQASIQAVLNGVATGTRVFFMPGTYALTGPLTVAVDNTHIDARTATFTQATWGQPGFDAIGRNGCLYDIRLVQFSGTRGGMGSSYRGSSQYCSGAGVWINGDNNFVRYLKTSYMPVGVFLSSWNGTSTYDRVGVGNRIGILESDHANWGLLYVGQQDLIVDDIYAHDDLDDSAGVNPTHVVYGSAITTFRATGGEFRSVRAKNVLGGQPFQIKYHDKLHVGNVNANTCKGLINVIDCHDLTIDHYTGIAIAANGGQGAITFQRTNLNSQRTRMGSGYIQLNAGVDERVVNILCDNGTFDQMIFDTAYDGSATVANTPAHVVVRGTGNRITRPIIRSTGTFAAPGIYAGFGEAANGLVVDGPEMSGVSCIVKVDPTTTAAPSVVYDPKLNSWTGTTGAVQGISFRTSPRALTPFDFGAVEPISGSDNTTALVAWANALAGTAYPSGAEGFLPPGLWRTTQALALNTNTVIRGAGPRSRLSAVGTNNLFEWNTVVNHVVVENLYLEGAAAGKAIFAPQTSGGIFGSTFRNCFMIASTDTSQIWAQTNAQSFIGLTFLDVEMQRTATSSVVPFSVVNSGGGANFNKFDNVRINGQNNVNTPFFHFESTLSATYMTDWVFINILGEQNPGGMIRALAPYNWNFINVTDEDSTVNYVSPIIDIKANSLGFMPNTITMQGCGRRGRAMAAGVSDLSMDPGGSYLTLIECNPTPASQNSVLTMPKYTTLIGMRGFPADFVGSGSPEGVVTAYVSSTYRRLDGGAGTSLYVKESGVGTNTGWIGK